MSRADHALRVALVATAGASIVGAAPRAEAQRPRPALAAPSQPAQPRQPAPAGQIGVAGQARQPGRIGRSTRPGQLGQPGRPGLRHMRHDGRPVVVVVPPVYYSAYPAGGYPSTVYDVNGRPLSEFFDEAQTSQGAYPTGTPDLSGSPYLVLDDGAMSVDFGNGDTRTLPSCATLSAARTPDGKPRTIFYNPSAGGGVLRAGTRGRVLGTPPAGARICYTWDAYGRTVLSY